MGDSEGSIEYTPEELAEIDRVLGTLPLDELPRGKPAGAVGMDVSDASAGDTETEGPSEDADEFADFSDDADGLDIAEETVPVSGMDEIEDPDSVVDITGLIEEVPEEDEALTPVEGDLDALMGDELLGEVPEIDSGEPAVLPELDEVLPEVPAVTPARRPRKSEEAERTTLDELEDLTSDEGIAADDMPSEDGFADIGEAAGLEEAAELQSDVTIDRGEADGVPDLSELTLETGVEIPEATDSDIPEIDLDSIPDGGPAPGGGWSGVSDDLKLDEAMPSVEEIEDVTDISVPPPEPRRDTTIIDDIDSGPSIRGIDEIEEVASSVEIPEVDEEPEPSRKPVKKGAPETEEGEMDLSDRELRKLKTAVSLYHPNLRKAVTEAIVDELLSPGDQRQLVDMIISSKPEENVRRFLEKKLGRTIDTSSLIEAPGRRVLTSRTEYTREGMERQKKLLKFTKIFGAAALATCVITVLLFQFVYRPAMAKRKTREGVALIRATGIPPYQRAKNFEQAEHIFKIIDEDYVSDYIPGYNAYARAYFDVKEFAYSYQKLKKAYEIKPGNTETLNNLGYFYSRVPEEYYRAHYEILTPPDKKQVDRSSRLDIAIRFYNYVLTRDSGNTTAMYGIGNTYMYQGRYFEARRYYENILKHERDSVVGYSGLLNLFIERDDFPEAVTLHTRIKDRGKIEELDPALLAKLAWYYLTKKRTDGLNIRVDYGVQADRFRDLADNPYPVVREVLKVLGDTHPEYPPLYLHKALLARDTGNHKLMREYLELAIRKEQNYFGAHHLMGSYHLMVKEPAEAFRSLKTALKVHKSPPEFTFNDFYRETESPARTYGLMGNVFYYYFDKVRSRYRHSDDLEEVVVDSELEKKANDGIAQEYYEKAIAEGDSSSEIFYNLGRLYYQRGLYNKSLEMWLKLYDDFISRPELMFALGNAFYRMNNLESGKGEFLRLISVLERQAEGVPVPSQSKVEHVKLYRTLSSAYNNLGVIYQIQGNEVKANLCYWRSIDYAKQLERENEYARVNMSRSFKERREAIVPLLDDEIPFSLDIYRADMR